jgi:hypothetical protein
MLRNLGLTIQPVHYSVLTLFYLKGRRRSYRYVDAVKLFGRFLEHKHLERAYDRAGPHFTGDYTFICAGYLSWKEHLYNFFLFYCRET